MSITHFCFVVGGVAALFGMSLGIFMGIAQDFSLTRVHAHLNLLGWVTMALYGLYYRDRSSAAGRLQWTQVWAAAFGVPLMTVGLALMLTEAVPALSGVAEPAIITGSLLTITAMALFLSVVVRDAIPATKCRRGLEVNFDFDPKSS